MDAAATAFLKEQINLELKRSKDSSAPPENFDVLPDIPGGRYVSREFYALEQQHIWSKSWLLAGHTDEIPNNGDFVLWERLGVPIIINRDKDANIHAFYNTCMHRGGPVVAESFGNRQNFRCQYHSWLYSLDGELKYIPDEHDFGPICKKSRSLKALRCETLGKLIFINRDNDAVPLLEALGPMEDLFQDYEPDKLKFVKRHTYEWSANWKVVLEAFFESYHVRHVHPHTINQLINHAGCVQTLFSGGHSRNVVPYVFSSDEFVARPAAHPLEEGDEFEVARSCSVSLNVFPNFLAPITRVRTPLMLVWPQGRDKTVLEIIYVTLDEYADPESEPAQLHMATFDAVLQEDAPNLKWVQRSLASGALEGVPLSYQERAIYHFQEHIDCVIRSENVPTQLRIEPKLGEFIQDVQGNFINKGA